MFPVSSSCISQVSSQIIYSNAGGNRLVTSMYYSRGIWNGLYWVEFSWIKRMTTRNLPHEGPFTLSNNLMLLKTRAALVSWSYFNNSPISIFLLAVFSRILGLFELEKRQLKPGASLLEYIYICWCFLLNSYILLFHQLW